VTKKECGGIDRAFKKVVNATCSCICRNGWKGTTCDVPECQKNQIGQVCGGRGKCVFATQSPQLSVCKLAAQTQIDDMGTDGGWYDIRKQGCCNDYCRFVKDKTSRWWSCVLAGNAPHQYTLNKHYLPQNFNKCAKKGEVLYKPDTKGQCVCDDRRFSGPDCDETKCPVGKGNKKICSGRGVAKEVWEGHVLKSCTCECKDAPGWTGAACDETK
jgi:hypothetical protein